MEFGILGPLLVADESGPRAVRAAKQRTLLAALLLRAGRTVPVDQLVDTLWDGRPPASAVPSLRNYVLRLRSCVGAGDTGEQSRIGFRDRGYVIEIDPDEVDLLRFTRLRDEGTAAFERGHYPLAGGLLGKALGQWRGPALVDVQSDALHREECPHLAESRLDVVELRLEAELRAVGRVPWSAQLRDLARAHPERERLGEYLISSLHSSGRGAEALAEYRRMERTLERDYGTRPGERLRALHERLTAGDAADAGAAGGAGHANGGERTPAGGPVVVRETAPIVPFQIPAAPADLTGRERETRELAARLAHRGTGGEGAGPTVLSGQPGIGKTVLALHAAHAVREAFPGGVLYADLHASGGKPARPGDVLGSFLRACGMPARTLPSGLDDRAALLRSLLADRATLFVLDDAASVEQIRPLLPGPGAGAALITARTRLNELGGVAHIEPGALAPDAGLRLLGAIAGAARTAAEPSAAAELVRLCEGLPLALRVAGTRLAARPGRGVRWLVERMTAEPGALLEELRVGRLDVRSGLAEVCARLDAGQARDFRMLAAAGRSGRVRADEAARLLGVPERRAEQLLEHLVDRYLLACGCTSDYTFRPLTRAYGCSRRR